MWTMSAQHLFMEKLVSVANPYILYIKYVCTSGIIHVPGYMVPPWAPLKIVIIKTESTQNIKVLFQTHPL